MGGIQADQDISFPAMRRSLSSIVEIVRAIRRSIP